MTFEAKVTFCCSGCTAKALGVVQFDTSIDHDVRIDVAVQKYPRGWYGVAAWRPVYCPECLKRPYLGYERGLRDVAARVAARLAKEAKRK